MKKFLSAILSLTLVLSMVGCGSNGQTVVEKDAESSSAPPESSQTPVEEVEIEIGEKVSVPDFADFTLFKIQTTETIEGSMSSGVHYENHTDGEVYVDVILDITNTSTESVSTEDFIDVSAKDSNGSKFTCSLYALETDNNTSISAYESISPLSTVRLHCAISVPEKIPALTIHLNVDEKTYCADYTLGKTIVNSQPLTVGQTLGNEDFATVTFLGTEYTEDFLPSNTSSYYSHYQVDNPDSIYLVVKYEITNYQGTSKDIDTFVGSKAVYDDKYNYTGFIVAEDDDKTGFSQYTDISPLATKKIFTLIEVPKVVMEKPLQLHVTFNSQEYCFSAPV